MKNLVKIGLIGLGSYLAYDYMQKRKKNKAAASLMTTTSAVNDSVSPSLIEAGIEEEGEEGAATAEMSEAAGGGNTSCWSVGLPAGSACEKACVQAGGTYQTSGRCVGHSAAFGGGRASTKKSFSRADGWDSDTISAGM